MLIFNYPSKKVLKEKIGQPLNFRETSIFGAEYLPNGRNTGCNQQTGYPREFFANVIMKDGLIAKVT